MSRRRWDYSRFLDEARTKPDIDFSFVRPEHFTKRGESIIPLRCMRCGMDWSTTVKNIFNLRSEGCPSCGKRKPWTLRRLLTEGAKRWPTLDFSRVREEDITNYDSPFWVTFHACGHDWRTTIAELKTRVSCPHCTLDREWTWEKFFNVAKTKPNIDVSLNKGDGDISGGTIVVVKCTVEGCGYVWKRRLINVIACNFACTECTGISRYSYDIFMKRMYGRTDVDLRLITSEQYLKYVSKLPFVCTKCGITFETRAGEMVRGVKRCPCRQHKSRGEEIISDVLTEANIEFETQVTLESLPKRFFDFRFSYNGRNYLVEFDGGQHFNYVEFFHQNYGAYLKSQAIDILKSQHACQNGYFLIRIDCTQINNIREHLHAAVTSPGQFYLSRPELYAYLFLPPFEAITS